MTPLDDAVSKFIEAACVPLRGGYGAGNLEDAESILASHPDIVSADIHSAAILGNDVAVRMFIEEDPATATAPRSPRGWDALTHLAFSKYLRLDRSRSDGFVRSAAALLDAGADPNTGYWDNHHLPQPEWESVLYGAAGVAHHPELTRILVNRGANANDGEVTYHAPEGYDNGAMKVLVESGKLEPDSLAIMLLRKADWHDYEGIIYLLEQGADPNRMTPWGYTTLHQSIRRDNSMETIKALLDHHADPRIVESREGKSGFAIAARRGRGDVLSSMEERGTRLELYGVEELIAGCARGSRESVQSIVGRNPALVGQILFEGGKLMAEFAGNGNTEGVRLLVELGVPITSLFEEGDSYFDEANNSTALHVAAWRAQHDTVRFLIRCGAQVNARDGMGRTPLELAVRACVDSYWSYRRSPGSVKALLDAGAEVRGIEIPTGYRDIDELLAGNRNSSH